MSQTNSLLNKLSIHVDSHEYIHYHIVTNAFLL